MPSFRLVPKSHSRPRGWWLLGLAAGGLASVGAVLLYRTYRTSLTSRIVARPRAAETAVPEEVPALVALGSVPDAEEWVAADPAYSDPALEVGASEQPGPTEAQAAIGDADEGTEAEPWLGALRQALERDPRQLGYGRSAWTAPLLGRYLLDTQGITIPLPRLREAIKGLGYQWQHTRYVQTHS